MFVESEALDVDGFGSLSSGLVVTSFLVLSLNFLMLIMVVNYNSYYKLFQAIVERVSVYAILQCKG